jgi:TonB family protein
MKKRITLVCFLLISLQSFAQDLEFEIRGEYTRPITKDILENSNLLSDIIVDYPVNWVKEYVAVEVITDHDGKKQLAEGTDLTLSKHQKTILKEVDLETEIEIKVRYRTINAVTEYTENNEMNVKMTVVPKKQAEFPGGYEELKKYLKENIIDRVIESTPEEFQKGKVSFIIDSTGKLTNPQISASSGNTDLDNFLLEMIGNMPSWKPAQNADGQNVRQRFEFSMGIGGC